VAARGNGAVKAWKQAGRSNCICRRWVSTAAYESRRSATASYGRKDQEDG
jgi:hypothetical protein